MGYCYLFIDESGDQSKTEKSSKHYILTGLATDTLDYNVMGDLTKYKIDNYAQLAKRKNKDNFKLFHATEDFQSTRDFVFQKISNLDENKNRVFSVVIEKEKVYSPWNFEKFHKLACRMLINGMLHDLNLEEDDELIICFDIMPMSKQNKSNSLLKIVKDELKDFLKQKKFSKPYSICHHESIGNIYLQIIDYISWALYRKHEKSDNRSFDLVSKFIQNIFYPMTRRRMKKNDFKNTST